MLIQGTYVFVVMFLNDLQKHFDLRSTNISEDEGRYCENHFVT